MRGVLAEWQVELTRQMMDDRDKVVMLVPRGHGTTPARLAAAALAKIDKDRR